MDSSTDAMLAAQATRRGTGKGIINSPNILRSSRSMEHRSPSDALLRLFPAYKDENEELQTLQEEQQFPTEQTPVTPPVEQKPTALQQKANHLAGRDMLADLHYKERKEAEKNHIIMLNL